MLKMQKSRCGTIKIAICDDACKFLDCVEEMLKQYLSDNGISAQADLFRIPLELIDAIEKGMRYDIYLLDIYMPGISGMSIATELRSRDIKSPIIFLTSSTDHALEAFGVDATHYLLKPYTKEIFRAAMDKAMQSITSHQADSIVLKVKNDSALAAMQARRFFYSIIQPAAGQTSRLLW